VIIIDTNVVSELMKIDRHPTVALWISNQSHTDLHVSAITIAEVFFGIELLDAGKKRFRLEQAAITVFDNLFADRCLPFDNDAARVFADIKSHRTKSGFQPTDFDMQIAATARVYGATLATRNTRDFDGCGLTLINPWQT
jgi:predicted nucleic acid-binding protein